MEENFNHPLKQRIEAVRTALMYGTLEEGIQMPTVITNTIRFEETEEGAFIWLMMKEPWHSIQTSFPVKLQYYQKGVPHMVRVEGGAEVNYLPSNIAVLKVRVINYEYSDLALPVAPRTIGMAWFSNMQTWLKENITSVFRQEPAAA